MSVQVLVKSLIQSELEKPDIKQDKAKLKRVMAKLRRMKKELRQSKAPSTREMLKKKIRKFLLYLRRVQWSFNTGVLSPVIEHLYDSDLPQGKFAEAIHELIECEYNPNPKFHTPLGMHRHHYVEMYIPLGESSGEEFCMPECTPLWACFDVECYREDPKTYDHRKANGPRLDGCGGFYPTNRKCKCGK